MQSNSSDNCIHHDDIKISNPFDPELQVINAKPEFKNKLKGLLTELKSLKFKQY